MTRAFVSLVSFVLVSAPLTAHAQRFEDIGVRAQGMAGAFVAVADDATATWWNPAGLATGAFFNGIVEYDSLQQPRKGGDPAGAPLPDWRLHAGGFAVAFPALGLSYYRLNISEIRPPDSTAAGPPGRQDQGVGLGVSSLEINQFGASFGQSLGDHLVIASTLKLLRAQSETHGDADIGAMAVFGAARIGLAIRNVTAPEVGRGAAAVVLARQARAGISLTSVGIGRIDQVTVALDADLTRTRTEAGEERQVSGGIEAWTLGRRLGLRGGLSANTTGSARPLVAGGASVGVRSAVYVDGQVTVGTDEARRGWGLGLRVTF